MPFATSGAVKRLTVKGLTGAVMRDTAKALTDRWFSPVKPGHSGGYFGVIFTTGQIRKQIIISPPQCGVLMRGATEIPHKLDSTDHGNCDAHDLRDNRMLSTYSHCRAGSEKQIQGGQYPVSARQRNLAKIVIQRGKQQLKPQVYGRGGLIIGGCPIGPGLDGGAGRGGRGLDAHLGSPIRIVSFCCFQKGMKAPGSVSSTSRCHKNSNAPLLGKASRYQEATHV